MKKYLFLILVPIFLFLFLALPKVSLACTEGHDMSGIRIWTRDVNNSPLGGIIAMVDTTNEFASTWDSAWARGRVRCDSQAFVDIAPPHSFFGHVGNWTDFWSWGDGVVRFASGREMLGGGSCYNINAATYGVACDCNHGVVWMKIPPGYEYASASYTNGYGNAEWVQHRPYNATSFSLLLPLRNASRSWGNLNVYYRRKGHAPIGWHDNADSYNMSTIFPEYSDAQLENLGYDKNSSEKNSCQVTVGWTCDADNYDFQNDVHFYLGAPAGRGMGIGSTTARHARNRAVGGACGGRIGHGFIWKIPDWLKDGKDHLIYAHGIDHVPSGFPWIDNPLLSGTPVRINCPPTPYSITINKTEVGDDGAAHTWKYEVQRYNIGGTWGAGGVTKAQITIPAGGTSGSAKVTLPEKDAAKDCADNGGSCLYRVVEKDIDAGWNVTRDTSSNITLTNSSRTGTASFENTYDDTTIDVLTTTLTHVSGLDTGRETSPGRLGFVKEDIDAAGASVKLKFSVKHSTSQSDDKLDNQVLWSQKVLKSCDTTNCDSPMGSTTGDFVLSDGGTDTSVLDSSQQGSSSWLAFTKEIRFGNPGMAYLLEVKAKIGHAANLNDSNGEKTYRFWVVPQRALTCDIKIEPLEFILGQSTKAVSPTGVGYILSEYANIDSDYAVDLDNVLWNIDWADGTSDSSTPSMPLDIPLVHQYATKPSGDVKLNITGMSGDTNACDSIFRCDDTSCKSSVKVRTNASSDVNPVSPNR